MLKKVREKNYINRKIKKPLEQIEKELHLFSGKEPLALCPNPTGNSWQGVLSATEGLFGNRVFKLPQYYSKPVYSLNELKKIANFLGNIDSEQIIFSGYLPYFKHIITELSKKEKKIGIIYHGSHASVLEDPNASIHFIEMKELLKNRIISKVGLVKKDMDKTLRLLTGYSFHPIILKTDESLLKLQPEKLDGLNIGVLTHDGFRKNFYNQLSAALLHKQAKVHVKGLYASSYIGNIDRIVVHGHKINRLDFLKILGAMTMNLYVTYSECWGQFVNESLALGVPCLTSNVSAVLDFDEELKKMLTVEEFDNDYAIYKKSLEIVSMSEYFKKSGPAYVLKVNREAEKYLNNFIYA